MVVSNSGGSTPSATATLTVTNPTSAPIITTQPASRTVQVGSSVSFTVVASGQGTLTYQWRFNGANIAGANTSTYTIASAQTSNAGNYDVIVSNSGGSTPSSTATLTVTLPPPIITTQPASQTVQAGNSVSFSVVASGQGTLNYQWRFNAVNILGANASTYTIASAQTSNAGNYDVIVSNSGGSTPSATATLTVTTVISPPVITTQPASRTVQAGSSVSFTVVASGQGTLTYRWRFNGVDIAGATASTYTIASAQTSNAGNYDVIVSNSGGSTPSATATLTVTTVTSPPTITTQPASRTVQAGSSVSFTVVAGGQGTLSYQWRFNGANIAGANASTYTITSAQPSNAGNYDVIVSNSGGSTSSATATLTVTSTAQLLTNGSFESGMLGWAATGSADYTSNSIYSPPDGVNVLHFNYGQLPPGGTAAQTFATTAGQVYSLTFQLGAFSFLNHDEQRLELTVQGSATLLSRAFVVFAPGNGAQYTLQSFTFVADSSSATLTFRDTSLVTKDVDVMVDDVRVSPSTAPFITTQPASQSVQAGSSVSFSVSAAGQGLSYQWRLNGINIAGANASTYTIPSAQTSHAGNYDVIVSNTSGSATSAVAVLTVSAAATAPAISTQPVSQTVAAGSNVSFSVAATGSTPFSYQWRFNGGAIAGATASTYTISGVQTSHAGNYDVIVSNSAGSATSAVAVLTVSTGNLVVNGSFESDYTGWSTSGNQSIATSDPNHPASSGVKVQVFSLGNAYANGVLSQTISTVPGQRYLLSFDFGTVGPIADQRVEVVLSGSGVLFDQILVVANLGSGAWYVPQRISFVANSSSTTTHLPRFLNYLFRG